MRRRLTIHRKGYSRGSYRRRDGTYVSGSYVPPTVFSIKDRGALGRGRKVIHIRWKGTLREFGYSVKKPAIERRVALRKAVAKYGEKAIVGKFHAMAIMRKRTDGSRLIFAADRNWVARQYGTYYGK